MIPVSENGEIMYDESKELYYVNNETYSEYILITPYKFIAELGLVLYAEKYLGECYDV